MIFCPVALSIQYESNHNGERMCERVERERPLTVARQYFREKFVKIPILNLVQLVNVPWLMMLNMRATWGSALFPQLPHEAEYLR
jgi:hypothetical protein